MPVLGPSVDPRPLTQTEQRWVARLKRVMKDCPPTLDLLTIGDRYLDVLCRVRVEEIHEANYEYGLEDGGAEHYGATLATVRCPCPVHGVSG